MTGARVWVNRKEEGSRVAWGEMFWIFKYKMQCFMHFCCKKQSEGVKHMGFQNLAKCAQLPHAPVNFVTYSIKYCLTRTLTDV